jgi:cell wall-associated NlpC family hydrolase
VNAAPITEQLQALQAAVQAPNTSTQIKSVLQRAFALLGTPYRWGGTSPDRGFDCSGLVGYVFRSIGVDLPRVSRAMAHEGIAITDPATLAEGDLVFFGRRNRVDHVGIYIGDGKFLHAPRTGRDVTVSSLASGYWARKYMQARRIATGG